MINSNTSFGKLKTVVVGRELNLTKRLADFSFQHFYNSNLNNSIYEKLELNNNTYTVNHELLMQRIQELDGLASLLEGRGIKVYRPDELSKVVPFSTPSFKSELSSASNVRDVTLVYGNKIIETPTYVRNRYFENLSLYDCYNESYNYGAGGQWIRCPHTELTEDTIDLSPWDDARDYDSFDRTKYTMAIDGAQFLRIGKDVIVNINSYNHYLGFKWIESFYPDTRFHIMHIADNHIDGALACLKPGVFLVNPAYPNMRELLPYKFRNWKLLYPEDLTNKLDVTGMSNIDIQLASSRGMDINVLSISESDIVVSNRAYGVKEILDKNGFNVIEAELNNGEVFGGGIHCSTLDILREDEYKWYT